MIILGIDPGITRIGYGLIKKEKNNYKLIEAGLINTEKEPINSRLIKIEKEFKNIIKKHKPNLIGLEKIFFSKNKKTAMKVSEARGVIMLVLTKKNIPFFEITPNEAKISVTGIGNADKKAVAKMISYILKIDTQKYIDDTTDALAIAIAASDKNNSF
jgi:crossover junction endodeoxyribonuclease RuvC